MLRWEVPDWTLSFGLVFSQCDWTNQKQLLLTGYAEMKEILSSDEQGQVRKLNRDDKRQEKVGLITPQSSLTDCAINKLSVDRSIIFYH